MSGPHVPRLRRARHWQLQDGEWRMIARHARAVPVEVAKPFTAAAGAPNN